MAYTATDRWGLPLEETSSNVRPMGSRRDTSGSHEQGQSGNRDSNLSRRGPNDPWNIMSDSEGTKQRRQSLKATNAGASPARRSSQYRAGYRLTEFSGSASSDVCHFPCFIQVVSLHSPLSTASGDLFP